MDVSPLQLPPEVWNHVFGCLSATDKFSVRASCKYFKKLVDHGSLWKDWVVVLSFKNVSYNSQFWASLRRRKVTSAVVRSRKAKDWKQLSLSLPTITSLVIDQASQDGLDHVKNFPNLKRLAIRRSFTSLQLDASTVSQPELLTHLCICDVKFAGSAIESFISALSQFINLKSLICHETGISDSVWMIHSILACLPKLKHLSLSTVAKLYTGIRHSDHRPGHIGGSHGQDALALSSLELINYTDHSLPEDAMRLVPGLRTLAVVYKYSHQELAESWAPQCDLQAWLNDLPQLSALVVVKGPPVHKYVCSIPATVTSLVLRVAGISSKDLAVLAMQLPNLLHLHIDPWPSHLGALTGQIPRHFPKLKSLKLRHEHVPEKDFLCLHKLEDLKYLEILDSRPHPSELVHKLQSLTNNRLQVSSSQQRDILACPCFCHV